MNRKLLILFLILCAGPLPVFAQMLSLQTNYQPTPVRKSAAKVALGGYQTEHAGLVSTYSEGIDWYASFGDNFIPGFSLRLYSSSRSRQRHRFKSKDTLGNEAACYTVAGLRRRSVLYNVAFKRADSVTLSRRSKDLLVGWLLIRTAVDRSVWNLNLHNPNETRSTYTTGTLASSSRSITIERIRTPAEFLRQGQVQEALLAGSILQGYLFKYNGVLIAALDVSPRPTLSRRKTVLWCRKDLDANIGFVVANLTSILLLRQDLR